MRIVYLIMICLLTFSLHAKQPTLIASDTYHVINDDNPAYAYPVADKSQWQKRAFNGFIIRPDISWFQIEYDLPHRQNPTQNFGVFVSILGAFDAYWDGQLIAHNGVVGDSSSTEIPGIIDKIMLIPPALSTPGKHTLSLRVSSQHVPLGLENGSFFSLVTDYEQLIQLPYKKASRPLLMSGALILVALYSLFLFFTSFKQPSYLIFSALCLTILSLMLAESWRGLAPYTYDWQIPRLQLVLVLSCLASLLLTAFFGWFYQLKHRHKILWLLFVVVGQLITLVSVDGFDNRSLIVFIIGVGSALGITVYATLTKQQHAVLMLGGLILFIAPISINMYSYMDQYFFLSFSALLCLMLYTLAQTMNQRNKQLIQSQLTSNRLELELVKRNLQPHFILNTLTAVEEWIEESPATAVKFINALADEFRFMAATSAQSIITLKDEIALCQSHLKVMSYRTNIEYSLIIDANLQHAAIPPGIILTLVENAISHNHYQHGHVTLSLVQTINQSQQTISFTAPIDTKKNTQTHANNIHLGLGSQYIDARLNESFGAQWTIESSMTNDAWQMDISFPLKRLNNTLEGLKHD